MRGNEMFLHLLESMAALVICERRTPCSLGMAGVGRERAIFRWRDRDVGNGIAPTA